MTRILGINASSDASISVIDTDQQAFSGIRKERLTKITHDWGDVFDLRNHYKKTSLIDGLFDLVVLCNSAYDDPVEFQRQQMYSEVLSQVSPKNGVDSIVEISHHLAHLYSGLIFTNHQDIGVLVIDFMGSFQEDADVVPIRNHKTKGKLAEVCSMYQVARKASGEIEISVVGKHFWDGNVQQPQGLGAFYYLLTKCFFLDEGCEGKVMALASYGDESRLKLPPLEIYDGYKVRIPQEWLKAFETSGRFDFSKKDVNEVKDIVISTTEAGLEKGSRNFQNCANLAAAGQMVFQNALLQIFNYLYKRTKVPEILFTGGVALNSVANGFISEQLRSIAISIPPWPDDGGTSIGAAIWGLTQFNKFHQLPTITLDFMGPSYYGLPTSQIPQTIQVDKHLSTEDSELIEKIAKHLSEERILGIFQGPSEFGPRALGNRSILGDPRKERIKDFINSHIKGREWFRPVAPVVLASKAKNYFDFYLPIKYMQFVVPARMKAKGIIPGVLHIDGTARIQTLTLEDNPFLFRVIESFEKLTGVPMLINTSLNPPHTPILETPNDALDFLINSDLDGIIINSNYYYKN